MRNDSREDGVSSTTRAVRCAPVLFLSVLCVLLFASYPHIVTGRESFGFRDFCSYSAPVGFHLRESLWRGEIPLWNPLHSCGIPFLAQWSTLVLYPLSLFFVLLPLPWALSMFCLLHLLLGGFGAYMLARYWLGSSRAAAVAGVAFAFNGMALSFLMWPHVTVVYGWMPWVVLGVERAWREGGRWICIAALVGALQMMGGVPEFILQTWFISILFALVSPRRRESGWMIRAGRLAAVVGLVASLTAVQLFPFLEFFAHSHRRAGFIVETWAMPSTGWANLLVPLFNCYRWHGGVYHQLGQWFASSYYPGIIVLALAVTASIRLRDRRVHVLAFVALTGMVLSLGEAGFVHSWLQGLFPALGYMRYPIKFILLFGFSFPLLAAYGAHAVVQDQKGAGRVLAVVAAVFVVLISGILVFGYHHPLLYEVWRDTLMSGVTRALFLTAGLIILFLLRGRRTTMRLHVIGLALLVCLWLDIKTHTPDQNPSMPAFAYEPNLVRQYEDKPMPQWGESRLMVGRDARTDLYRTSPSMSVVETFLQRRLAGFANANLLDRIPKLDGFYSLYLHDPHVVLEGICYAEPEPPAGIADFLGVSRITAPGTLHTWSSRPHVMPFIYSGQQPEFLSGSNTLIRLRDPELDLRRTVILPLTARPHVATGGHVEAAIEVSRMKPHLIEFTTDSSGPALVTIAQSYYHLWRATVDGVPVKLFRANGAFQALEVPAGRCRIRLAYVDRVFRIGLVVSGLTLALLASFWQRAKRTRVNLRGGATGTC